jgi:aspartate racemase
MKPKPIGIVGGAGPLAGALLLERILKLAMRQYGCYQDADFPAVTLVSYPFSDMLSPSVDGNQLRDELQKCLVQLRSQGALVLGIACNTLHAFLEEEPDLVHMPRALAAELCDTPLVLCTETSVNYQLHQHCFPCIYPSKDIQAQVDAIITSILKGNDRREIAEKLLQILCQQKADAIVLGCTELSLFSEELQRSGKTIVDTLDILAKKILEKSFESVRKL